MRKKMKHGRKREKKHSPDWSKHCFMVEGKKKKNKKRFTRKREGQYVEGETCGARKVGKGKDAMVDDRGVKPESYLTRRDDPKASIWGNW